MPQVDAIAAELARITELSEAHARQPDEVFAAWFVRAFTGAPFDRAFGALCGGSGDRQLDAVFWDDDEQNVLIVQSKYRTSRKSAENREDVVLFATLSGLLTASESEDQLQVFMAGLNDVARTRLKTAAERLRRGYSLELAYATTGSISEAAEREAFSRVPTKSGVVLHLIHGTATQHLFEDYRDDVTPPIPSAQIQVDSQSELRHESADGVRSRVVLVGGLELAKLYKSYGLRLFARNIRGYLGNHTPVNVEMRETIARDPSAFFYLNNGVTMLCDRLDVSESGGRKVLSVSNPQIINGQQTTRSLAAASDLSGRVQVMLRVVESNREDDYSAHRDMVARIVKATNWQNPISIADLRTNDEYQIQTERSLRRLGYEYLRRSETKVEAARRSGESRAVRIKKTELVQAIGTCKIDRFVARIGPKKAFGDFRLEGGEEVYSVLFGRTEPVEFVNAYWIVKYAKSPAFNKQFGEARHAKWLVAHAFWQELDAASRTSQDLMRVLAQAERTQVDDRTHAVLREFFGAAKSAYRRGRDGDEPAEKFFKRLSYSEFFGTIQPRQRDQISRRLSDLATAAGNR